MLNRRESLTGVGARYRALLEISSATASEPNIEEMLHRTSAVLSGIMPLRLIGLQLLEEKRGLARLHVLETGSNSAIEIVTDLPLEDAASRAIEEQRPIFLEGGETELPGIPELTSVLAGEPIRSFCAFPLSTLDRKSTRLNSSHLSIS